MHVCTIVGARPQFIKAAVVSRALAEAGLRETLIHTGQHYDDTMSQVFFDELSVPAPVVNLGVGSGPHGAQTGAMLARLETYLLQYPLPDWVLVYGDTNSTLAGALVASKLKIPLAHVEAGLRSFNRKMPEEVNRLVADRLADQLFCPTQTAMENLHSECITDGVHHTGDVMLDATRYFADHAARRAPLNLLTAHAQGDYCLATVHRAENTDNPARLAGIFEGLRQLDAPVVLPLHPRMRERLSSVTVPENVEVREPVSYLAMLTLVRHARRVLTDSGGLQKEALWLGTPCITLRDETEWVETLENGWNRLAGGNPERIVAAAAQSPIGHPAALGESPEGRASDMIVQRLREAQG